MKKHLHDTFNAYLFKTILVIGLNFIFLSSTFAQTLVTSVEAESGTRGGGLKIATANAGYSGSGYVTNMINAVDILTIPVTVSSAGNYKLVIRYNGPYGNKDQNVYVNGSFLSTLHFPATTGYTDLTAGSLTLKAGANTIAIYSSWGYTDFDKISLYTVPLHDYTTVAATPIDPAATTEAIALYNYLKSNYGQTIISGQTSDYYNTVSPNAAKKPVIRAFDFQHYTVGYPYLWNNTTASHTFGWEDDGTTQAAIDWYNSTCQKGMVAFHWHWHSPSGGQAGKNTFYTNSTTFDVTKAVTAGTVENTAVLRDIDSIATQLKRLQDAGVPVLWRPLHEAGGEWFWWGAKGPAAALALYDIVYNRLTSYHKIHNLIWQWSTPEPNWYPGNAKVDMLGYDSYPGDYNYGTQKLIFDQLYTIVNGQKMLAMTENGPIPDPDACFAGDAKWSYFMSWSDLVTKQNSAAQLTLVYNHAKVVTLDEVATATNTAQLTAGGPTSFCSGGNVLLKANVAKGYAYKWYNGTNVIAGATSATYSAITAGSYTVAVTATGSCTTTSAPIVVTMGGPVATITPATPTTFCQGGSVILNASTGTGYTYQWYKDANLISGVTSASYTASATGLYTVKVTASTCNTTSAGTQVTVNAMPTIPIITVSGVSTFCTGWKTQLNVSSDVGSTLEWLLNGSTSPNQSQVITTGGSYSVKSTKLGCSSTSAPTVITVTPLPVPTITASGPTTFCQGGNVDLTASSGTSYQWYEGTTLLAGATNAKYTANASGNYKVTVGNPNGCTATTPATTVTVNAAATPTISINGSTICQVGGYTLTASAGSAYKWMSNGAVINGATNSTYIASASAPSYTVEVTNASNCKATSSSVKIPVIEQPIAAITAGGSTGFCEGGSVILTASKGISYKWMFNGNAISGGTNATYEASVGGSYKVEVNNGPNCIATSAPTTVSVLTKPIATITTVESTTICPGWSVTMGASTGASYQWMLNGNAISGGTNAAYTATSGGSYTVDVISGPNCKATSTPLVVTMANIVTWYLDTDGDGKGDPTSSTQSCKQPFGYVAIAGDACPDDANKIIPGNCGCGDAENSCLDCMGVPNGKAALDVCNICAGGTSGVVPKTNLSQCITTSTKSALATNLKMYPNPTVDNCMIELSGSAFRITVYTSAGVQVFSKEFEKEAVIGTGLSQGIYLVRIEQDGNVELRKLVKE